MSDTSSQLGEALKVGALFVTVWLWLVGLNRTDLSKLIERVRETMAEIEKEVVAFWITESAAAPISSKCAEARFLSLANRLHSQLETCRSRLSVPKAVEFKTPEIIDALTMDIESRATATTEDRNGRFFRVHESFTVVDQILDHQFDRPRNKILWWGRLTKHRWFF